MVAMAILLGVYLYSTRAHKPETEMKPGDTANAPAPSKGESSAEPELGAAMLPVPGTWISPDGKDPELKGKVVLLDFWGIFCPPCRAAIPNNNKLYEKYAPKGFVLAGVTIDKKVALDDFKTSVDVRYPLLSTPVKTFEDYGIQIMPTTYLYDKSGKLVWKGNHLVDEKEVILADFEKALTAALAQ